MRSSILDRGPRDAPERQQTLRATLDWSFDLLDRDEQDAFTALGAFAGGCELDAAEAVTGAPLEVLEQLVAKSLVTVTARPARDCSSPSGSTPPSGSPHGPTRTPCGCRHLDHYVALAERTETAVWALERGCPEFAALQRDHDNLRAAVSAGLRSGEARRVLRLVSALSSYMWFAEAADELRRWWEPAYAAAGADLPVRDRARARFAQSRTTHSVTERLEHIRAAVALFREVSDDVMLVRSLADLALFLTIEEDRAGGRAAAQEALAIARRLGDDALIGASLAELAQATADPDEALALAHEAAGHLRAAGALVRVAQLFSYLGFAALAVDAYERSEALAREALGVAAHA